MSKRKILILCRHRERNSAPQQEGQDEAKQSPVLSNMNDIIDKNETIGWINYCQKPQ
jgi:hypothetical protein